MLKKSLNYVYWLAIVYLASSIGSAFTFPAISNWYAALNKAPLNPPNWIFGPVWTLLFTLMGIAAAMVWEKGYEDDKVRKAAYVFMLQLFLNVLWSVLFFGLRQPGLAVVEIVLLWLAIIWTIKCFAKVSEPAAWLLLPYLVWVSFASYLNFMVALLNR